MKLSILLSLCLVGFLTSTVRAEPLKAAAPTAESLVLIPELACTYETTVLPKVPGAMETRAPWRMWRSSREVEIHKVGSKDGEAFALDGAGGVMVFRILHPERSEVFFNAMEVRILGGHPDWNQCCSVVSKNFLMKNLARVGEEVYLDRPVERFTGEVEKNKWTVLWSEKDSLAVSVMIENDTFTARSELRECYALKDAPWERLRSRGYRVVPYTELGDNDTDPAMKRLMSRMGIACSHKGCGPVCLTPQP